MAAILTITSTAFADNALIPALHKSASACGEANLSPQIAWIASGDLAAVMVTSYELSVIDVTAGGFVHWQVDGIDPTQLSIAQSSTWLGSPTIGASDYGSGDDANGWNGPCNPDGIDHTYEIRVRANIHPDYVGAVGDYVDAVPYTFRDNVNNVTAPPTTGGCGTVSCAPGATLIDGLCQVIEEQPATVNPSQIYASPGDRNDEYGKLGTRLYNNIDGLPLPIKGFGSTVEDNGSGNPGDYPTTPWVSGTTVAFDQLLTTAGVWQRQAGANPKNGRLNRIGIWASTTFQGPITSLPTFEWIGFTQCIEVDATKTYWVGLAADNRMRFKVNGTLIVEFPTTNGSQHQYWYIFPMTMNQGVNILEVSGMNTGNDASFGVEIYDPPGADDTARKAALVGATTAQEVDDMTLFNTNDSLDEVFTVGGEIVVGWTGVGGELSGTSCPEGYTLSPAGCAGGECVRIEYSPPTEQVCSHLIQNCKDENDEYLIELDPGETAPLYGNNVYVLAGDPAFTDKCFIYIGLEALSPTITGVTITTDHGTGNCVVCDPSQQMESCENPGEFSYVALAVGQSAMTPGNIYELDAINGCQTYIGETEQRSPDHTDVTITTDYNFNACVVCVPCLIFRNCNTGGDVYVRLADGQFDPSPNEIVQLGTDPAIIDQCWQFIGYEICTSPNYTDVEVALEYGCVDCEVCTPKYLLTDCSDASNTMTISWDPTAVPLDEAQIHVFDFDLEVCWTAEYIAPEYCDDNQTAIIIPNPEAQPFVNACAYNFADPIEYVATNGATYTSTMQITNIIVNGTSYITPGNEIAFDLTYTGGVNGDGLPNGINWVPAANQYGFTYTEQVDAMNAALLSFGITNVKVQIMTNDLQFTNGTTITMGAFYILNKAAVTDFEIWVTEGDGTVTSDIKIYKLNDLIGRDAFNEIVYPERADDRYIGLSFQNHHQWITCDDGTEVPQPYVIVDDVVVDVIP